MDKRGNALRRRPSVIVRMAKLKIVGSQHEDDERQRRIDLDALRQALKPVPAWFEWVIPRCTSPIQAIFNDSQLRPGSVQLVLEHAWPALVKRQPIARIGNDAPSQRIGVNQNLMHINSGGGEALAVVEVFNDF